MSLLCSPHIYLVPFNESLLVTLPSSFLLLHQLTMLLNQLFPNFVMNLSLLSGILHPLLLQLCKILLHLVVTSFKLGNTSDILLFDGLVVLSHCL